VQQPSQNAASVVLTHLSVSRHIHLHPNPCCTQQWCYRHITCDDHTVLNSRLSRSRTQGKGQGHRTLSYQHTTYKGCLSRQVARHTVTVSEWHTRWQTYGTVTLCLPNRVTNHRVDLRRQTKGGVLTVANLRADVGWWTKGQT